MLWSAFAEVRSTNDFVAFVQKFGPLEWEGFARIESEGIERALAWAGDFRALIRAKASGLRKVAKVFRSQQLAKAQAQMYNFTRDLKEARRHVQVIEAFGLGLPLTLGWIELKEDPVRGIKIVVKPEDLISGLRVQLVRMLSGPTAVRNCRDCGTLFQAGPGTSRRADATFCCKEHSVRYHSLQRSRGG
jgi:hypothetical protein